MDVCLSAEMASAGFSPYRTALLTRRGNTASDINIGPEDSLNQLEYMLERNKSALLTHRFKEKAHLLRPPQVPPKGKPTPSKVQATPWLLRCG